MDGGQGNLAVAGSSPVNKASETAEDGDLASLCLRVSNRLAAGFWLTAMLLEGCWAAAS